MKKMDKPRNICSRCIRYISHLEISWIKIIICLIQLLFFWIIYISSHHKYFEFSDGEK